MRRQAQDSRKHRDLLWGGASGGGKLWLDRGSILEAKEGKPVIWQLQGRDRLVGIISIWMVIFFNGNDWNVFKT